MNQSQLEQQLRIATSRTANGPIDDETESLRQSFAALGDLLDRQSNDVDDEWLIASVLQDRPRGSAADYPIRSEAWLVMSALAASLLLLISLAATQFSSRPSTLAVNSAKGNGNKPLVATADESEDGLSWDDDWDSQYEQAREFAASYRTGGFLRLEATTWSASEALRELRAELDSM
jgi:hypothetical protein